VCEGGGLFKVLLGVFTIMHFFDYCSGKEEGHEPCLVWLLGVCLVRSHACVWGSVQGVARGIHHKALMIIAVERGRACVM